MANVILAKLIEDWLKNEQIAGFSIVYPGYADTIMVGYEGSIKYDHHSEGYATVVSIYDKCIYIEYDSVVIEASRPDFFEKLKDVLVRHKEIHAQCKHLRAIND